MGAILAALSEILYGSDREEWDTPVSKLDVLLMVLLVLFMVGVLGWVVYVSQGGSWRPW